MQVDLEMATGLLRSHISRIENGRRAPSLETLERLATALKVPLYVLFYPISPARAQSGGQRPGEMARKAPVLDTPEQDAFQEELKAAILRLSEPDQRAVLATARKMARRASSVRKRRG